MYHDQRILRTYSAFAKGNDYHRKHLDRYLPHSGLFAEVGCAEARVGKFYQNEFRRFIGFDLDQGVMDAAMRLGAPKLINASAFQLPLEDGSIDAYIGLGIFELDGAKGEVGIAEAARVTKPGGLLYVTVPYKNVARSRGSVASWRGIELPCFDESDAYDLLSRHGFVIQQLRPSSIVHGIGPFRRLAPLFRGLLVRERGFLYFLLGWLLKPFANSLLIVGYKQ